MSTVTSPVANAFIDSLKKAGEFPLNINDKQESRKILNAYHGRLNDPSAKLCVDDGSVLISVPIHTFRPRHERKVIKSLKDLRDHHGIVETVVSGATSSPKAVPSDVVEADPDCRMVFLHAASSRSKLKISKTMLLELMTFHSVMPQFLDFVHIFGQSENAKETSFSTFRERTSLSTTSLVNKPLDSLNRSNRRYELCYNLKTVDCKPTTRDMQRMDWAIHHFAVYHEFDIQQGNALWIFIQGSLDIEERVHEVVGPDGRPDAQNFSTLLERLSSSLTMHSMLAQRASESWRWYLRWLDTKCDAETRLLMTEPREPKEGWRWSTEKDPQDKRKIYTAKHLQDVQKLVELIRDATGAIEDNIDVITALAHYYKALPSRDGFPVDNELYKRVSGFAQSLENVIFELRRQHKRATALAQHAGERRNLLMQYVNAQATETQERLANSTYEVGLAAQNEAIVMRIITVVTLIFLPATFVSTFFSTDVIKYQDDEHKGRWSSEAMNRWLQITLPLTALTLTIAAIGYHFEKKRQILKRLKKYPQDPEKGLEEKS